MLPRVARLRHRRDFTVVVRQGRRVTRGCVAVYYLPPSIALAGYENSSPPTVGFIVGRGVGGSVVRHRVSRQLRHIARERLSRLPRGSKLVIRALPSAATRAPLRMRHDVDTALDRLLGVPDA